MADNKAAFGVFPQMKPKRSKQDREAAKNVPVDLARGFISGTLGMPGDIESLARLPYELITGKESPTILPTSEDIEKRLPFRSDSPVSQAATGLGQIGGGFYTGPLSGARAAMAVPRAVTRAGKDFLMAAPQGAPRMFIGPKAKTWDQAKADAAARMEREGVDPVDIWRQTGTLRGADGIQRQEISDVGAVFRNPQQLKELGAEKKAQAQELQGRLVTPIGQKDFWPKQLTEAKKPVREEIKALKADVDLLGRHSDVRGQPARLALEHPELYAAYPELGEITVYQGGKSGSGGTRGSLMGGKTDMQMDITQAGLRNDPRSTALHEMQHAVQTLEDMAPGGSPTFAFNSPITHEIYKRRINELYQPPTFEEFQRANRIPEDKAAAAYDEFVRTYKPIISPAVERAVQQEAAMEYYKRLAGEAEARATQAREPMSARERVQEFPYSSYDVLPEDLIVKPAKEYNSGGSVFMSDNPDAQMMEVMDKKLAGGGLLKGLKTAAKAARGTQDVLPAAERQANLQRMLAESKTPMRLYHGTTASEGGKGAEAIRRLKPSKEGSLGSGVYLTPQTAHASNYSGIPNDEGLALMAKDPYAKQMADQFMADRVSGTVREGQQGGNMLPVYAQIKNPLILEGRGDPMVEALIKLGMDEASASRMVERAYENKGYIGKEVETRARAAGYDGLMQYRDGDLSEVVSYNPNAVKSAIGNKGTYDTTKPELNEAGGGLIKGLKAAVKKEPPAVNRLDMNYKDVTKRVPELTEAAKKIPLGEVTSEEYAKLVNKFKPVKPYEFVPQPATAEDATRALTANKKAMFGKTKEIPAGQPTDLRLDIPAYKDHGVWVNSVHRKGEPTAYGSVSSVKNATMFGAPDKALRVATGEAAKGPWAVISGEWNPMDEAAAVKSAQEYLNHKDWRQVGYDPERHGYFYDRQTMAPILGAEEVIQIGPLVLAKKPKLGDPKDFPFKHGGEVHMAEGGAAFGVFPQMKPRRSKQDPEAAKDVPKDVLRGVVAGALGAPSDIANIPSDIYSLVTGNEGYKVPYGSEHWKETLPLPPTSPVGKAAQEMGGLAGGVYTGPGAPIRAVASIPGALKHGALEFAKASAEAAPRVYRPHTPLKPDPDVGTRYKVTDQGGLAPRKDLDIEAIKDSQAKIFPWDATSRNKLVTEVSDVPLTKPVLTEGGDEYMLDLNHIKQRIAGASNEGIAKRIMDRINEASVENRLLGTGTGRVFGFPIRMGEGAEMASTFPTDIALDLIKQAGLTKKEIKAIDENMRNMVFEGKKGAFKDMAPFGSPEFEQQLRKGLASDKEKDIKGFSPMNMRKAFMDRMGMVENQKRLGYNLPDLSGSVLAENLKGVPKGYVGNVAAELDVFGKLRPSKSSTYDTDFPGVYAGSMPNMPVEILMPKTFENLYREMKAMYPNAKPEALRNMAVGAMEKRKKYISETIGQRNIDAVKTYQEGLAKQEFDPYDIKQVYDYMRRKKLELKLAEGGAVNDGLIKVQNKRKAKA
jgi:O6-methylguanine-DNA--protein-cysteine methyltransferase